VEPDMLKNQIKKKALMIEHKIEHFELKIVEKAKTTF